MQKVLQRFAKAIIVSYTFKTFDIENSKISLKHTKVIPKLRALKSRGPGHHWSLSWIQVCSEETGEPGRDSGRAGLI